MLKNESASAAADIAFDSGAIERLDSASLRAHLLTIANQPLDTVTLRHVVRALWLNSVLLQRHIERSAKRNSQLLWIAAALALTSLLSSLAAVVVAVTREARVEIVRSEPPRESARIETPRGDGVRNETPRSEGTRSEMPRAEGARSEMPGAAVPAPSSQR